MVDASELNNWPKEDIPDSSVLYMRVHRNQMPENVIIPGVFRNHGGGMSTEWNKYATAEETRERVRDYGKDPNNYAVIQMVVRGVREIPEQSVEHTPNLNNRAHTDVFGEKDEQARLMLKRICKWAIRLK